MPLLPADVACWVLKTNRPPEAIDPDWRPGTETTLHRCLRPTYRLGLMAPGQRCLLWLSGRVDPGVHAIGVLASVPDPDVDVVLRRLADPVPRADLLLDPDFATAEVIRMPFGSNPSYLRPHQLTPLLGHLGDDAWGPLSRPGRGGPRTARPGSGRPRTASRAPR